MQCPWEVKKFPDEILCKISIITHASAVAFSSVITYIAVNQEENITQQYAHVLS